MPTHDFAVVGLGRFGTSICRTLRALGHEVLAIDSNKEKVQQMRPVATDAVQLDASDPEALRAINITEYGAVVVAIGVDLESSILVTMVLKELGVTRVLAKAGNEMQRRVLSKVGADVVVFPEEDGGYRLAHSLVYPVINDFIDLGEDYLILDVSVKPEWTGHTLEELRLVTLSSRIGIGSEYAGLQVQLVRRGRRLINMPGHEFRVEEGDVLAVVGTHRDLGALTN